MAEEFKMIIIGELAVLKEYFGFRKALRIVSWQDASPKLDLREWTPEGRATKRGFTLADEEARLLLEALEEYFEDKELAELEDGEDLPF